MTKKTGKATAKPTEPASGPLYAMGVDEKGKPRGGRFAKFDDKLTNAILDMGLAFVISPIARVCQYSQEAARGPHLCVRQDFSAECETGDHRRALHHHPTAGRHQPSLQGAGFNQD